MEFAWTPEQLECRRAVVEFARRALGYACEDHGLRLGLAAQMWRVQMPLFRFGTEDQRRRHLARLNRGEWIGAHAMSWARSRPASPGIRLSGRSPWWRCLKAER
jgi:alkylation response protein AidB-like acyl-CoA dehydrogenase